jgi:hypothetical protein
VAGRSESSALSEPSVAVVSDASEENIPSSSNRGRDGAGVALADSSAPSSSKGEHDSSYGLSNEEW